MSECVRTAAIIPTHPRGRRTSPQPGALVGIGASPHPQWKHAREDSRPASPVGRDRPPGWRLQRRSGAGRRLHPSSADPAAPRGEGVWSTQRQPEWAGLAWAGVLLGGPGSGLGGEAAWHLWDLGPAPSVIDVVAPRRCATQGPWRFSLGRRDFRGELPRSSVEDTTADVCAAASRDDSVVAALSAAIGSRRTTAERLRSRFRHNLRRRIRRPSPSISRSWPPGGGDARRRGPRRAGGRTGRRTRSRRCPSPRPGG